MSTTHIQPLPNVRGRMSYTELGEGGCVHVHATIANHDLVSGTAIAHGTDHATVKRKNDRLSREMGFTVVGPEPARERTAWAERKGQFGIESFERVLGNRVADARDHASNMEEFLEELKVRGVELTETRKVDEKTGEETVGWSYKSRDPYGKSRRKRRRRASNLADDLTREGIEAYFEAKQRELEVPQRDAPAPEALPDVPETVAPEEQPSADFALDVYDLDRAYVSEMASDLQKAHIHRSRDKGKPFMDERYEALVEARNHPDEQLAKLREDVDTARREFHASKEALDTLQHPCPGLLAGMHVFAKAACAREDAEVGGQGHAVRRVAEKIREQRQAAPFLKYPLAGYEETLRRAVDGRTRKGRKIGVFVVRSFMSRIRKTRETDGTRRGREARLETGKSPDEDPIKP